MSDTPLAPLLDVLLNWTKLSWPYCINSAGFCCSRPSVLSDSAPGIPAEIPEHDRQLDALIEAQDEVDKYNRQLPIKGRQKSERDNDEPNDNTITDETEFRLSPGAEDSPDDSIVDGPRYDVISANQLSQYRVCCIGLFHELNL